MHIPLVQSNFSMGDLLKVLIGSRMSDRVQRPPLSHAPYCHVPSALWHPPILTRLPAVSGYTIYQDIHFVVVRQLRPGDISPVNYDLTWPTHTQYNLGWVMKYITIICSEWLIWTPMPVRLLVCVDDTDYSGLGAQRSSTVSWTVMTGT